MPLIIETGEGLPDSQAYCDLAYLNNFALLRGEDLTAYDDTAKEAALYRAANDYVDALHVFKGTILNADQAMSLPTTEVGITRKIKDSNAQAAILSLKGLLFVEQTTESAKGEIKREKTKLDVIEEEIEYTEGTSKRTTYPTPLIDGWLRSYLAYSVGGVNFAVSKG